MEVSTSSDRTDEKVVVGRIIGPWGVRGDVKVEPLSDYPHRFSPGSLLYVGDRPSRVVSVRPGKGHLIVKLDAVTDRDQAEKVRGQELTVPREHVAPLPEGHYYHFQVLDMEVHDEGGRHLGRIKEIISTEGNDIYVVGDGKELLVPAIKGVVLEVDLSANRMRVRLPDVV